MKTTPQSAPPLGELYLLIGSFAVNKAIANVQAGGTSARVAVRVSFNYHPPPLDKRCQENKDQLCQGGQLQMMMVDYFATLQRIQTTLPASP